MNPTELSDLLQAPVGAATSGPDLPGIRRRGLRLRRVRRISAAVGSLVVVAGLGAVAVTLEHGPGSGRVAPVTGHTELSAYVRSVLRKVPGSYAVDGTAVLPDRAAAGKQARVRGSGEFEGTGLGVPQALGFHLTASKGSPGTLDNFSAYQRNAPKGSNVVVDAGPASISCVPVGRLPCMISVLAQDAAGDPYWFTGFDTASFLHPGAPMVLFPSNDWSDHQLRRTVIGGFAGTGATRVRLLLSDGSTQDATLARGTLRQGATLFWARTSSQVVLVKAYAADGRVLETHHLRACTDPIDCEVR